MECRNALIRTLQKVVMSEKIQSGSLVIDTLLNGGFEKGIITTIFGAAGTGKSNIAMQLATTVAKKDKIIYIDTEGGFSPERIKQMAQNYLDLLDNIILFEPTTFDEQKKVLQKIKTLALKNKVPLIIIDSIAMLYRLQKNTKEEITATNTELANQLAVLGDIARKNSVAVVVTNQVYAEFDKRNNVSMVGGDLLNYGSKCLIKLTNENGIRKASIVKHRSMPLQYVSFGIDNSGIIKYEKEKKGFKLF